jgi:cytochrome c oxidase subunit 3
MIVTILLGAGFLYMQYTEYCYSEFTIADSVYGNLFFSLTGLHGLHVIVGVLFLTITLIRMFLDHFTTSHHRGFEMSAYYWHLVDVVWLFLFLVVYVWAQG